MAGGLRSRRAGAFAILLGALAPGPALGQSGLDRLATVYITTTCEDPQTGSQPDQQGTGFIVERQGYVMTAAHVISCWDEKSRTHWRRKKISARIGSPNNQEWHLDLLREDDRIDVAVLKFLGDPPELPALKMCALRRPPAEMKFVAAGFPEGKAYQSVDGRIGTTEAGGGLWAAASPFAKGMSGGPVAYNGSVVGLVKGGRSNVTALSAITPIHRARTMIEDETGLRLPECAEADLLRPRQVFRDCPDVCPEMVVVLAGEFIMGSNDYGSEKPPHNVTIARPFAVGKFEVTFAEWGACVADGGCTHRPSDQGWGRGRRPVINVSWHDAKEYVSWLSGKTGKSYRLLSEAEWEYAARAGTTTRYAFGDAISKSQAQYDADKTAEVGSFAANRFGLHDLHGNVWEWVEDNWQPNYQGAPVDGSVWQGGDASLRVLRGGSWGYIYPDYLRSAYRLTELPDIRSNIFGFRVARTL